MLDYFGHVGDLNRVQSGCASFKPGDPNTIKAHYEDSDENR